MKRFGTLKTKILQKLSEVYIQGDKKKMKEILSLIIENKDFRDLYLFYDDIESKYISNKEDADTYIERIIPILKEHKLKTSKFCKELDKKIGDVSITENTIYLFLDKLIENDTLKNTHSKIDAKKQLIEHLIKTKDIVPTEPITVIENESLLHTILSSNFNALYGNTLNEEDQKELKAILSLKDDELNSKFDTLKEEVGNKLAKTLTEETKQDIVDKLNKAMNEVTSMNVTKFNYYKLQQLRNGL